MAEREVEVQVVGDGVLPEQNRYSFVQPGNRLTGEIEPMDLRRVGDHVVFTHCRRDSKPEKLVELIAGIKWQLLPHAQIHRRHRSGGLQVHEFANHPRFITG